MAGRTASICVFFPVGMPQPSIYREKNAIPGAGVFSSLVPVMGIRQFK